MFEFVTGLFSAKQAPEQEPEPVAPPQPKPEPPQAAAAPSADIIPAPVSPPPKSDKVIDVPYRDIVGRLPASVAPLASSSVTGVYSLPVETAMAQLPSGAVRVRFADLRRSAPAGNFAENGSFDDTLVDLPLAQILAGLNPMLLTRRTGQRQIDLPEDVDVAFKPGSKPPAPRPIVEPLPAVIHKLSDPVEAAPKPPEPKLPAPVPKPPMPSAPLVDAVRVRLSVLWEFWPEDVRQDITQCNWRDASVSLPMGRLEAAMKTGRVAFVWTELIQWLDLQPPANPTPHGKTSLEIPLKVVAPLFMAQRRSVVVQKNVVISDSVPDLFAAPATTTKIAMIPAPEPLPEPAPVVIEPPVQDVVATPAPVPEAVVETVPAVPAPAPASVILEQNAAEPAKAEVSPQEIVEQVNALAGVAGSLIAMSDGFLVAGDLPAPLKGEMTAAFLPQMFGRQAHYAKEIQLGPPNELSMVADGTPLKIFKAGTLFLAVLGKTGETLPDAPLRAVATELAKRNP